LRKQQHPTKCIEQLKESYLNFCSFISSF
jgi:hypothetical protein